MTDDLLWHMESQTIPAAFALLPGAMTSREAVAMLLAIGLQESGFRARRQGGSPTKVGDGPARGFWQFERAGGVAEILTSPNTKDVIVPIVKLFCFQSTAVACHEAIQNHDVLAACLARLLIWRDPRTLPSPIEQAKGWDIYLKNWRPGAPHPETWPHNFKHAWEITRGGALL